MSPLAGLSGLLGKRLQSVYDIGIDNVVDPIGGVGILREDKELTGVLFGVKKHSVVHLRFLSIT